MVQGPKQDHDDEHDKNDPDDPTIEAHAIRSLYDRTPKAQGLDGDAPMTVTADGCWADFRTSAGLTHGRPCLFLDRDGVVIEDTGYPHDPERIVLVPEALAAVAAARRAGYVTGIVSNQSGIARGYFGWPAFAAVQAAIDAALREGGTELDFVLACPHHPEAVVPHLRDRHAWRKPEPGMLVAAQAVLGLDMRQSIMIGDRPTDLEAARRAGVPNRILLAAADGAQPPGTADIARSSLKQVLGGLMRPNGRLF